MEHASLETLMFGAQGRTLAFELPPPSSFIFLQGWRLQNQTLRAVVPTATANQNCQYY